MMEAATITLHFATNCAQCGAVLNIGDRARYYPGNEGGKAYGIDCHKQRETPVSGFRRASSDPVQIMMRKVGY